ncbi:MAG: phosphonate C-P lyase system protein PhnH [Ramlibacter sp.]|nr:phosphonate C-P lyase system protein PhnH [Ramlibacter sp.]
MTVLQAIPSVGFTDPVHDAQRAFRGALDAFSHPGRPLQIGRQIAGLPLGAAMAHLLLAMTDPDTPVWWQAESAAHWVRFHTGAGPAAQPLSAAFGVITRPADMPALDDFARGTTASPEFSTTLLIEVLSLDGGPALQWHGPGIQTARRVQVAGLAPDFWTQWQANHAGFPQGVDVIFTCGDRAIGLPRTTRVARLEGIT